MLNKIIVLLLVVLVVLFVYQNRNTTKYQPISINKPNTPKVNVELKASDKTTTASNSNTQETIANDDLQLSKSELEVYDLALKELDSDDIDERIKKTRKLTQLFSECKQLSMYNYRFESSSELFSTIQKKTFERSRSECQELKDRYKYLSAALFSSKSLNIRRKLLGLNKISKPTHPFRYYPKTIEERVKLSDEQLQLFLSSESPQILNSLIMNQQSFQYLARDTSISKILGSYDINYITMINNQALTIISCGFQSGDNCKESSIFMLSECFNNEQACGLTVKEWFYYAFTDSHLDDIDLVVSHYLNRKNS